MSVSEHEARYEIVLHRAAERELASVTGPQADQLKDRLKRLQHHEEPTSLSYCKQLEDYPALFRAKADGYRAILSLQKPQLWILAVDTRSRIYDKIETAKDRGGL